MERQTLILRRRFVALRADVYTAWTEPVQLAAWWGPTVGATVDCALDVRVGGAWRVSTRLPDGTEYPLSGVYLEVLPGERLVFTMNPSAHPDAWHAALDAQRDTPSGARGGEVTVTVTLADGASDTTMTVAQHFSWPSDRDAYYRMGAPTGWGQSFDKLERLLATNVPS